MCNSVTKKLREVGCKFQASYDILTQTPKESQRRFLSEIIGKNSESKFGKLYNFSAISDVKQFQKSVPIHTYDELRSDIERCCLGDDNILTTKPVFMFNLTSGTTNMPKYIPMTDDGKRDTGNLMTQWFYRNLIDHPKFLNKKSLIITSAMNETMTASGIPCGSMSGLIYNSLPKFMHERFSIPFCVSKLENYDLKYYIIMRLAMEDDVSFIATPNPMTLVKLSEIGVKYSKEIITAIEQGTLFDTLKFSLSDSDKAVLEELRSQLKPNSLRANFLREIVTKNGVLLPKNYWPNLELIGCWLGGNIGHHANLLPASYGETPLRDLGYMASEGSMTLPITDNSASGVLALENNFYEFIPESETDATPLLAHELKAGELYRILITNRSGLYRYNINDTVKVDGFYHQTPMISFVRKSENVLNIMGEKVHENLILNCMSEMEQRFKIEWRNFKVIANLETLRYELALDVTKLITTTLAQTILNTFDELLSQNIEYSQKRGTHRLQPPCLHIMASNWSDSIKRIDIANGKRDIQYKWSIIGEKMSHDEKKFITQTYIMEQENE